MRERRPANTRREFLKSSCLAAASAGIAVGLPGLAASCSTSNQASSGAVQGTAAAGGGLDLPARLGPRVVLRADKRVFATSGHDPGRVRYLVEQAVASLVGVKDPGAAFRALFKPSDVVAIKLNCLAGPGMSSSPAVVNALVTNLRAIGIENEQIIIWERTTAELTRAGFEANRYSAGKPRCYGNDDAGYERSLEFSGEVGSLWTNVLARSATALINVPVLKDHDLSGVGCGMKNMYGAIHNPNRYHDNNCDPFVADVSAHPYIKNKLRLILTDALTAQYQGGPARVLSHQWRPASILAATDPVALDRIAQRLLEEKRQEKGLPSFSEAKRPPRWLATAAQKKLGEQDLSKIKFEQG